VIGKNTAAALRSGVIYGSAGQVDAIVRRVREELWATLSTLTGIVPVNAARMTSTRR
jgi:type III pantothenate kinase